MKPDILIATQITAILRSHGLTVETLSQNRRKAGVDGAKKMEVVSEIRQVLGNAETLDELAASINISPSVISYYTEIELI